MPWSILYLREKYRLFVLYLRAHLELVGRSNDTAWNDFLNDVLESQLKDDFFKVL